MILVTLSCCSFEHVKLTISIRAQSGQVKCSKCEPVVVVDGEDME